MINKIKIIFVGLVSIGILLSQFSFSEAKEKRKILLLQIIEENWDNLEFIPPKYKRPAGYKPPTKREVIKFYIDSHDLSKERVMKSIKFSMSKGYIPENAKLVVFHSIKYFGKTGEMKDNDIVERSIYRLEVLSGEYHFEKIPKKIPFLTEPWSFNVNEQKYYPAGWSKCTHIRLVDDMHILSSDASGNLKIKYGDKTYDLKVGGKVIFPEKEIILTKQKLKNYEEKFQEKVIKRWGEKTRIGQCDEWYIVTKGNLWFKTKVTIINYGYEEVEL